MIKRNDMVEFQRNVKVYSRDKNGNYVIIPLSRYPILKLINENLVYKIEIESNDITIADILSLSNDPEKNPVLIDCFTPDIIYGEDVDAPQGFSVHIQPLIIKSIVFKTSKQLNLSKYFYGQKRLKRIEKFVAPNVINTSGMFEMCSELCDFPDFDTSNVKDMSRMYYDCSSMEQAPLYETNNVENMDEMFCNCKMLQQIPEFKMDHSLSMIGMFKNCSSLKGTISLTDLYLCKNVSGMFSRCENISKIQLNNTDNIVDYSDFCSFCSSLEEVIISNSSSGVNFNSMFENCRMLKSVSLLDFMSAVNCERMFSNCINLESFTSINANKLENIELIFSNCKKLSNFDIGDISNINNQLNAFQNCMSIYVEEIHVSSYQIEGKYQKFNIIIDQYIGLSDDLRNAFLKFSHCDRDKNYSGVYYCDNLKYVELPLNVILEIKERHNCFDLLYISPVVFSRGKYIEYEHQSGWFLDDIEHERYYTIPSHRYFRSIKHVRNTVYDHFVKTHDDEPCQDNNNLFCLSLDKTMIEKVDFCMDGNVIHEKNQNILTSLIRDKKINKIIIKDNFVMIDILLGTDEIEELPIIEIAPGVVSCRGLFSDLSNLKRIEDIVFLSSEVEDLTAMFLNCKELVSIPSLKFSNVTVLDYLFSGCSSLKRSPSIEWLTESDECISMSYSFLNCNNLKSVHGIQLNGRTVADIKGIFNGCYSINSFMPLNLLNDVDAFNFFYGLENAYWSEKEKLENEIKEIKNEFLKQMLLEHQTYNYYASDEEIQFSSLDELQPMKPAFDFVEGVIDGVNRRFGIFVNIPSKNTKGLIHISKLSEEQKNNLNQYQQGGNIKVKVLKVRDDHKLELDFYNIEDNSTSVN